MASAQPVGVGPPAGLPAGQPVAPAMKKRSRFGGFFQRFSLRRLSGRVADNNLPKKPLQNNQSVHQSLKRQQGTNTAQSPRGPEEDVRIIPLHPTPEELEAERREEARRAAELVVSKPPLPPGAAPAAAPSRRPLPPPEHAPYDLLTAAATAAVAASVAGSWRSSSSMAGLLETDLDADLPPAPPPRGAKARSLLDVSSGVPSRPTNHAPHLHPRDHSPQDNSRAKSMEFLLDKRNQEAVQVSSLGSGSTGGLEGECRVLVK